MAEAVSHNVLTFSQALAALNTVNLPMFQETGKRGTKVLTLIISIGENGRVHNSIFAVKCSTKKAGEVFYDLHDAVRYYNMWDAHG